MGRQYSHHTRKKENYQKALPKQFSSTSDSTDLYILPFGMIYEQPRDRWLKVDAHQEQFRSGRGWCKGLSENRLRVEG